MKGYINNIEKLTLSNNNFRKVLYTTHNCQLVLMSLLPGEDIGAEVHGVDQFLRIEKGTGKAVLNGISKKIEDGSAVLVPAGTKHNIINSGKTHMKLYSLYMPPHHEMHVVHKTKKAAVADKEEFDGKTSV
jgi:Mannose-6-phosphate isomerase